jgi:hypothetical protein
MTHDELLASIEQMTNHDAIFMKDALRTILELHKPIISTAYPESLGICLTCTPLSLNFYEATRYPCPIIQAIEKAIE